MKTKLILAGIVFASLLLHLIFINTYSFWFDESFTSALATAGVAESIAITAADVHPPLYYVILNFWTDLFGVSDGALRSFSALTMSLSLVPTFYVVRRLSSSDRAALVGTALAALGPMIVRYGQEARMYGLSALFISGSTALLLKALDDKSKRSWALYSLLVSAAIWTHYFAGLIVVAHAVYVISQHKKLIKRWVLALVGAGVLFAPWLPTLYRQVSTVNEGFWIGDVGFATFAETISQFLVFGQEKLHPIESIIGWLGLIGVMWLGFAARRNAQAFRIYIISVGVLLVVMLSLFAISVPPFTSSYYYTRYLAQFAPLFYAGLGASLWMLNGNFRRYGVPFVALTFILGLTGVYRDPVRELHTSDHVAEHISTIYTPGTPIIGNGLAEYYDLRHYLGKSYPVTITQPGIVYGSHDIAFRKNEVTSSIPQNSFIYVCNNPCNEIYIDGTNPTIVAGQKVYYISK